MSVNTTRVTEEFAGGGTDASPYSFPYNVQLAADIVVQTRLTATGVEGTPLVLTDDYSVSIASDKSSATITLSGSDNSDAFFVSGTTGLISRQPTLTQTSSYRKGDGLPEENIEADLDNLMLQIQWQQQQIDRCIKVQDTEPLGNLSNLTLPTMIGNASVSLIVNSSVNGISFGTAASGQVIGPTSATNNAVTRFDGATGELIQNSSVIIDDSNNVTGVVALTTSGIVSVDDTTDTSSAVTGSIHTDGGVGIAKKLWVGTTSALRGAVTITSGGLVVTAGVISQDDTTDTSSAVTGSIHTDGGLGIAKKLWVGTSSNFVGAVVVADATSSTTTTTGSIKAAGGVGIVENLFVGGTGNFAGNVTISKTDPSLTLDDGGGATATITYSDSNNLLSIATTVSGDAINTYAGAGAAADLATSLSIESVAFGTGTSSAGAVLRVGDRARRTSLTDDQSLLINDRFFAKGPIPTVQWQSDIADIDQMFWGLNSGLSGEVIHASIYSGDYETHAHAESMTWLTVNRSGNQYSATTKTITGITRANPGVVTTSASHGYSNGDSVELYGVVGMTQVNGINFTVKNVTSTTFELARKNALSGYQSWANVDTSGYTAWSSGGLAQKTGIRVDQLTLEVGRSQYATDGGDEVRILDAVYVESGTYVDTEADWNFNGIVNIIANIPTLRFTDSNDSGNPVNLNYDSGVAFMAYTGKASTSATFVVADKTNLEIMGMSQTYHADSGSRPSIFFASAGESLVLRANGLATGTASDATLDSSGNLSVAGTVEGLRIGIGQAPSGSISLQMKLTAATAQAISVVNSAGSSESIMIGTISGAGRFRLRDIENTTTVDINGTSGDATFAGDVDVAGDIQLTTDNERIWFASDSQNGSVYMNSLEQMVIEGFSGVVLGVNEVAKLTIDSGGDATFAGDVDVGGDLTLGASGVNKVWSKYIPVTAMALGTGVAVRANDVQISGEGYYNFIDFDTAAIDVVGFHTDLGADYDGSELTIEFYWTYAGSPSGTTVRWDCECVCMADSEALGLAVASTHQVLDTALTAGDLHITSDTGTPVRAGSGTWLYGRLRRNTSVDDLSVDARLLGIRISYT